jgi:nucleotide-binding universal stress UspA family protein
MVPIQGVLGCWNFTELKQFRHIPGKWSGSMAPCILLSEDSRKRTRDAMSDSTTSLETILAPIDFSDFSNNALDVAADLASRLGAGLILVNVVPAIPDLPEGVSIFKEGEYDQSLHDAAAKRLSELAAGLSAKNIKVRTEIGTANEVGMEIVRIAEDEHADMIVIATHGLTGWRRIPFGSVAKKVVEEAECPVLVLRAQETGHAGETPAPTSSSSAVA